MSGTRGRGRGRMRGDGPEGGAAKKAKTAVEPKHLTKARANDCISLKCVRSAEDYSSTDTDLLYHPQYTNQIFEKEEILGYEDLKIEIFFTANSMKYFMKVSYSKRERGATDIEGALAPHFGEGLCKTEADFLAAVQEKYVPPLDTVIKKRGEKLCIFKGFITQQPKDPEADSVQAFHSRIQPHALLNIDGASYIDATDPKWEIYVVCEKLAPDNYQFVGYATMYPFLGLKNGSLKAEFLERIRISQVVILPQYQGRGYGTMLLDALYTECTKRDCIEITVEDPSEGFRVLRDSADLYSCIQRKLLAEMTKPGQPIDKAQRQRIQNALKITKTQAVRCYEMNMLRRIEIDDDVSRRKMRLMVKRRLLGEFADVLSTFSPEDKKVKLAELYDDLEQEYLTVLRRLVSAHAIPCPCLGS